MLYIDYRVAFLTVYHIKSSIFPSGAFNALNTLNTLNAFNALNTLNAARRTNFLPMITDFEVVVSHKQRPSNSPKALSTDPNSLFRFSGSFGHVDVSYVSS